MDLGIGGGRPSVFDYIKRIGKIDGTTPVTDDTASAGKAAAAEVDLGNLRTSFDVFYSVDNNNGDIVVEVSTDGVDWKYMQAVTTASGGEEDIAQFDTAFQYARAYGGNGYADADINDITVSGKGV